MKITAHTLAEELRKIADHLDREPEAEIKAANLWWMFHTKDEKQAFKDIIRMLPRPLTKRVEGSANPSLIVEYHSDALDIDVRIPQSATCTLKEPAKPAVYECEPILSEEEQTNLVGE